jgi:hypothetical protein
MSDPIPSSAMQRVLVAMDSPAAQYLLPAAAELAAQFQAELLGLFVENTDLLRLSGLPFAEEVCSSSAVARPLTREIVECRLRTLAEQLRRSLAETARQADVRWSFIIARGTVHRLLEESTRESDVLLLPQRVAAAEVTRHEPPQFVPRSPIAVVFDGSTEAERALAIGGQAAERQGRALLVVLATDVSAETLQRAMSRELPEHRVEIRMASTRIANERELRQVILEQPCSLLLLPANTPLLKGSALARLVAETSPLVAIVR